MNDLASLLDTYKKDRGSNKNDLSIHGVCVGSEGGGEGNTSHRLGKSINAIIREGGGLTQATGGRNCHKKVKGKVDITETRGWSLTVKRV